MNNTPSMPAAGPAQIALLLPLSGRLRDAGESLRDGFLAAYYQESLAERPEIRVYDSAEDVAAAFRRALTDGAGFVVGPLGKEEIAIVKGATDGHTPVLALNVLPEGETAPARFYQFALSPEDEARQVADRLLAEGRLSGVALTPTGEWGTRVLTAFQSRFTAGGGTVITARTYPASITDFSDQIVQMLGFTESQGRYNAVLSIVGGPLQFAPRRREDVQVIFFAGQPMQGRLMRPQLKFHYAGDLPVYSTSDVFEPNPVANQDLDGVAFVDMPWMISDEPTVAGLRAEIAQLWPANARRRSRLYAMGIDAWRLVVLLRGPARFAGETISGVSGRLNVDATGRVHRALDWALIGTDGQPQPWPTSAGKP